MLQPQIESQESRSIGKQRKGNTFDSPLIFGKEILQSGKSFTSCSISAYQTSISLITTPTASNRTSENYETIYFIKSEDELVER